MSIEKIREKILEEGGRWTSARQAILTVFFSDRKPLSPAEVRKRLAKGTADLASVYRTIRLFVEKGVLVPMVQTTEGQCYELSDDYREHHHHLLCGKCGQIQDYEDCQAGDVEKLIFKRMGFRVTRHDFQFYGLCADCL